MERERECNMISNITATSTAKLTKFTIANGQTDKLTIANESDTKFIIINNVLNFSNLKLVLWPIGFIQKQLPLF